MVIYPDWNNVYPDWGRGDIAEDGVQVVEGERDQVTRIVAHQHLQVALTGFGSFFSIFEDDGQVVCFSVHLVFDGHCHQVVELVHAVGVEPHDGGVGELVKHGLQHLDQGDSIKIDRITKARFRFVFINIIIMSDTLRLWMGWCFWKISSMKRRLNIVDTMSFITFIIQN